MEKPKIKKAAPEVKQELREFIQKKRRKKQPVETVVKDKYNHNFKWTRL